MMSSASDELYPSNESSEPVETPENVDEILDIEEDTQVEDYTGVPVRYRGATNDPVFGYLIALALSIGLSPLINDGDAELRYTLSWGVLALFGVLAWLFGNTARVGQETPDNAVWGVSFGLILAAPLFAFGGSTLNTAIRLIMTQGYNFGQLIPMSNGSALAYLIFVMPLAETLFFRGVLQENRPFWIVSLMGTLWAVVLFFPLMDLQRYPIVGFVICLVLAMMNLMYSYVRQRNGLAAAWICQIVVNLVLVFLPYLGQ